MVTVFGCTGMLGKLLVNRLAKEGHQIIIPSRQEPYYTRELRVCLFFFPILGACIFGCYYSKEISQCLFSVIVIVISGDNFFQKMPECRSLQCVGTMKFYFSKRFEVGLQLKLG